MPQSLSKIWTHLIFSTKDRYPFLTNDEIRKNMHAYSRPFSSLTLAQRLL